MRLVVRAVVVVAALAGGAAALLHLPPVQRMLVRALLGRAERAFGSTLTAADVSFNLFTRRAQATMVTLDGAPGTGAFITAREVRVAFDWPALGGDLGSLDLRVDGLRVTLQARAGTLLNLPPGLQPKAGPPLDRIPLPRSLALDDLGVSFTDEAWKLAIQASGLDATLDAAASGAAAREGGARGLAGVVSGTAEMALEWDGRRTRATLDAGAVRVDGQALDFRGLHLRAPEANLSASGRWAFAGGGEGLDLDATGTGRLERLGAWVERLDGARGTVALGLTRRIGDRALLRFDLSSADASWGTLQHASVAARGSLERDRATVDRATIGLAGGRLTGRGTVSFDDGPGSTDLTWHALDLARVLGVAGLDLGSLGGLAPAASVSGHGAFTWVRNDARAVRGRLDATLTPAPPAGRSGLGLDGEAGFRLADGSWALSLRQQVEPRLLIEGTVEGRLGAGSLGQTSLTGSLSLAGEVGGVAAGIFEAARVEAPALVRQVTGPLTGTVAFSGTLGVPILTIALDGSPALVERGDPPGTPAGPATLELRAVTRDADVELQGLSIRRGASRAEARGTLTRGTLAITIDADALPLDYWLGQLGTATSLAGTLRGSVEVTGRPSAPEARLTAAVRDLRLPGGVVLRAIDATAKLAAGTLSLQAHVPELGATLAGVADTHRDGVPFEGTVNLRGVPADALGLAVHGTQVAIAEVQASAVVRGRLADGAVDAVSAAVQRASAVVDGRTITLAQPSRLDWSPGRLEVDRVDLRTGATRATLAGRLAGDASDRVIGEVNGRLADLLDLAQSLAPPSAAQSLAGLTSDGDVVARAELAGPADRPRLTGRLSVADGQVQRGDLPAATNLTLDARLAEGGLTIDRLNGQWAGASVSAAGAIPAALLGLDGWTGAPPPGAAAAWLDGQVIGITERTVALLAGPDRLGELTLAVDGGFTLRADAWRADSLVGEIHVERMALRSATAGLTAVAPAHIVLTGRRAVLDRWVLRESGGTEAELAVRGTADLSGTPTIDLVTEGDVDLRLVPLGPGVRPAGRAQIVLQLRGALADPEVRGRIALRNGQLTLPAFGLTAGALSGTAFLEPGRLIVRELTGTANGGPLTADGTLERDRDGRFGGVLRVRAQSVLLVPVKGLQSVVDAALEIRPDPSGRVWTVSGTVDVVQAAYERRMILAGGLLGLFQSVPSAARPAGPARPDVPDVTVRLDVRLRAEDSVTFESEFGRMALGGTVRVLGTPSAPALLGQITFAAGSTLYLAGRRFAIENGEVAFTDPTEIAPQVRLAARSRIGQYDVTVRVSGDAATGIDVVLVSDPPLPEDEIASLILTGDPRAEDQMAQQGADLLVASLSGEVVGAIGRSIGLDVRLERGTPYETLWDPSVAAAQRHVSQRLTFSKRVGSVEALYSQSLSNSGDVTWLVAWSPVPSLELRVVRQDAGDVAYEFRHDVSFGGPPGPTPASGGIWPFRQSARERVGDVVVRAVADEHAHEPLGAALAADLAEALRLGQGDRFDFQPWQRDRERLVERLVDRGYYEARVGARREPSAPQSPSGTTPLRPVTLIYEVDTGPRTRVTIAGAPDADGLARALREAWGESPGGSALAATLEARAGEWLVRRGYLRSEVRVSVGGDAGARWAEVTVAPGPESTDRAVVFAGNTGFTSAAAHQALAAADLVETVWIEREAAREALVAAARGAGWLDAVVTVGVPTFDQSRARLPITIAEGPRYRIGALAVEDPKGPAEGVAPTLPLAPGAPFVLKDVSDLRRVVEGRYRRAGYVGTKVALATTTAGTSVAVRYAVERGPRAIVRAVAVEGRHHTSEALVSRATALPVDRPLDLGALNAARDRLYETGLFRSVTTDVAPVEKPAGQPAAPAASPAPSTADTTDVRVAMTVLELPRYRLRYGFQLFDPERPLSDPQWGSVDPGVVADLTRRGLFGRALIGGVAGYANPSEQFLRGYVSSRRLFGRSVTTALYVTERHDTVPYEDRTISARSTEFTAEQQVRPARRLQVAYGYSFERLRLHDEDARALGLDGTAFNVGRLTSTVVVDRRDEPLDATRGWFHSNGLEFGAEALGSSEDFRKWLVQQFIYLPLPGRVVLASAARAELTGGPGQFLLVTDRLAAGGANTVRGYAEDTLAVRSIIGALGGRSTLVVLNQEVRFPIRGPIKGVTFFDFARLVARIEDATGSSSRYSAGFGLRYQVPFALLRLDFGYPLKPDAHNHAGRLYFSIGQAF